MRIVSLLALLFAGALARECYMLQGRAGAYTPVPPHYIKGTPENLIVKERKSLDDFIEFPSDLVYFGCHKEKEALLKERSRYDFVLKDERVVRRRPKSGDVHLIVPKRPALAEPKDLDALLDGYTPQRYLRRFPKRFYGNGIEFLPLANVPFLPLYNLYELSRFYERHHLEDRMLILHNGVYSLEYLHKKIADPKVIRKVGPNTYEINVPIYISKTAALVIDKKVVRLQSAPKPVVIIYGGELYIHDSDIITWDVRHNRYHERKPIPKEEILLIGKQRPRPYLLGFIGSRSYFIGSRFKGLGFHSTTATFGVSFADLEKPDRAFYSLLMAAREYYKSDVALIGNEFSDLMIGFFSNNVDDIVLVGNYYHDNLIYDVDPHDYGDNFIIARNVTASAKLAHGIVLSREITHSLIAQNISYDNHSVGIMLDRSADYNLIYDNLLFQNGVAGITIQESDYSKASKNHILYNAGDGVLVRNSLATEISDNDIGYNLKNGVEAFTKDIGYTIYRDFKKDPYHKATAATIRKNRFFFNYYSEILSKNSAAIRLEDNDYLQVVSKQFDGDLGYFPDPFQKSRFTLYGMGYPYKPLSSDKHKVTGAMLATLEQIYCESQNPDAITFLGEILMQEGKRERAREILRQQACLVDPKAIYALAFTYFGVDERLFVRYLVQSAMLGYSVAIYDTSFLPYFYKISERRINEIYRELAGQMEKGSLGLGCDLSPRLRKKVIASVQKLRTKLRLHHLDFYAYAKKYTRVHKKILTPRIKRKIEHDFYEKNRLKIAYYQQLLEEELKLKKADRRYHRKEFVRRSLRQVWQEARPEAMGRIVPLMEHYLQKINRHRLEPLSVEMLLGKDK